MEVTEVIKSLRWLSNELRDEKRGMEAKICRVAADRLEKLEKEKIEIFAERRLVEEWFVPTKKITWCLLNSKRNTRRDRNG